MIWGVTVVTAVMKEMARKVEKESVMQRPSHCKMLNVVDIGLSSGFLPWLK